MKREEDLEEESFTRIQKSEVDLDENGMKHVNTGGFFSVWRYVCGLQLTNNKEKMFKYGFGHRDIN